MEGGVDAAVEVLVVDYDLEDLKDLKDAFHVRWL